MKKKLLYILHLLSSLISIIHHSTSVPNTEIYPQKNVDFYDHATEMTISPHLCGFTSSLHLCGWESFVRLKIRFKSHSLLHPEKKKKKNNKHVCVYKCEGVLPVNVKLKIP